MRVLLMLVLVHGLVPSFGEAVELAVHYAATGHIAHAEAGESDLGDLGREHGCGPTQHHCGCCPSQVSTPVSPLVTLWVIRIPTPKIAGTPQQAAEAIPARLLRPPIAAA
ncbi:hypothetical protein [Corallococcus macrosporus]|uniref:DUF2946 domain-containing protein n=2 Tax=Myxococcaceae TaxID=31 RepID=A0A250JW91_9BACT|nr:hypothetical protein [Corallococcus macrosporus]AEI67189.1 hypothetical protein LILAB_26485 [Corallococcus macrosporus]ATB47983.1 hypothetical protein MYMAC_003606 [Corallococcus macrosporus DSM 14697]